MIVIDMFLDWISVTIVAYFYIFSVSSLVQNLKFEQVKK